MPKVLCVDDSAMVRRLLAVVLSKTGLEVLQAEDGEECLQRMATERPDVVLLDMHMPGLDGIATLRRIAQDPDLARIPVVMLTGQDDPDDVSAAKALGARDFVVKPFEHQALRDKVLAALPGQAQVDTAP